MNAATPATRLPAGERGATRIAARVIAKIASQAAREALEDAPHAALVPADRRQPRASAVVGPARSGIRLAVELGYPADLASVCTRVRRHVVERVSALAGLQVPEAAVEIEIERLHFAARRPLHQGDHRRVR